MLPHVVHVFLGFFDVSQVLRLRLERCVSVRLLESMSKLLFTYLSPTDLQYLKWVLESFLDRRKYDS